MQGPQMSDQVDAIPKATRTRRRRLVDEIRDLMIDDFIANGAVEAGQRLPSELELSERYAVSRVTVRACIRGLEENGLIASRHGIGSIVLPGSSALVVQGFDRLASLDGYAREGGQSITTEDLEFERRPADDRTAEKLEIEAGRPVLEIRRAKLVAGVRAAWLVDHVAEGVMPFDLLEREFEGSTLDVLLLHPEVGVEYADTEIQAVNLPGGIARRLNVRRGTAALRTDAVARTADGRVVEWASAWLLPEHFRIVIRRRRR
jgi:GntR family transcriptional regulator